MQIITRAEAKAQGLTRYFTGIPCPHGHVSERQVSNKTCFECVKNRRDKWQADNPERVKAYNREHSRKMYWKDPVKYRVRSSDWSKSHKDKVNERHSRQYREDPQYRAYRITASKRYREEGPINPAGDTQWLNKAKAIRRALRRVLKSSSPDLSHLRKLDPNL